MPRLPRFATWLPLIALALLCTPAADAAVVPQRAPGIADLELRHPQLFIANSYLPVGELPAATADAARRDLDVLGLERKNGRFDLRSGRWGTLILSEPLIPGDGKGNTLEWAAEPVNDAKLANRAWKAFVAFLEEHSAQLRLDPAEMSSPGRVAVHHGGDLVQIWAPRVIDGVPVRDSGVGAVINHGNLVLLGAENWGDVTSSMQPRLSAEAATAAVRDHLAGVETGDAWRRPALEVVPLAVGSTLAEVEPGQGLEYRLAWAVHPTLAGDQGHWQGLVDAGSGVLLAFQDTNHYVGTRRVQGGVYPVSNDGMPPDGVEVLGEPMPFDIVSTIGGDQVTDTGGNLPIPVDGDITSNLSGAFVNINDNCGSISLTAATGDIDFLGSGGDDCTTPGGVGGPGNTHSARSGFYELNRIKEQARAHLPENDWLEGQLTSNMNINSSCNAFWNGSTVNFYRSGGGCGNTGELAGVFDHEWGHGMDDFDVEGGITNPGEGIADIYAALRLNTSCIGRGFFQSGDCGGYGDPCTDCSGIRDIDWAKRQSGMPHDIDWIDANCGSGPAPCGGIVHCEGAVHAEATWDLYTRALPSLYGFDSNTALEVTTYLNYVGAGMVSSWYECTTPYGGCNALGGYMQYLAADDDNGDLTDGTPHMEAIFEAYHAHQIACDTPVVQDEGCEDTPTMAPVVTAKGLDKSVLLDWDLVTDALSYNVYRTEGVFECDFGKVLVGSPTDTSFFDTGLQNDRDYSYVVIPMGPGATCWGPASACATAAPVPGPNVAVDADSVTLDIMTGDGDRFLDNCEMATVTFEVVNTGIETLTDVEITDVTSPSHPDLVIKSMFPVSVEPSDLAKGQRGSATFEITGEGLSHGDTVIFSATVGAVELQIPIPGDLQVFNAESDLRHFDSKTWDFETGTQGWTVIEGTFDRQDDAGGGADGTQWYEQSSSFLSDQCDVIRSPLVQLTDQSELALWTRFDIEPEFQPGVWYDRANLGLYDPAVEERTLLEPTDGRDYNASGANGTCGTDGQRGWADTMDSWASSTFGDLPTAGGAVQLSVRYGTDPLEHGYGFRFDEVTLTNFDELISDGQSDACDADFTLFPPDPGMAGQDNDLVVSGATPDGTVYYAASLDPGTIQLGCGAEVDIAQPVFLLGNETADGAGDATLTVSIPPGAAGRTVYFQAVDFDACIDSNRVEFTFP